MLSNTRRGSKIFHANRFFSGKLKIRKRVSINGRYYNHGPRPVRCGSPSAKPREDSLTRYQLLPMQLPARIFRIWFLLRKEPWSRGGNEAGVEIVGRVGTASGIRSASVYPNTENAPNTRKTPTPQRDAPYASSWTSLSARATHGRIYPCAFNPGSSPSSQSIRTIPSTKRVTQVPHCPCRQL
jgi:hypothetical protein